MLIAFNSEKVLIRTESFEMANYLLLVGPKSARTNKQTEIVCIVVPALPYLLLFPVPTGFSKKKPISITDKNHPNGNRKLCAFTAFPN